jgi:carbon-monoxide dehydrogenase iron sulfur subunit
MTEQNEEKKGISRRTFLASLGSGATGLVASGAAGGVVGAVAGVIVEREVLSEDAPKEWRLETPLTWVGRNLEACTGCRQCEIACSLYHEGVIWPGASRVRVYEFPPSIEFPVLCYQCADVPCVRECPADALSIDEETKTIVVNNEKCLRISEGTDCRVCADACPGSTILMHPVENVPMFCDLCGGDPECVKVCPTATVTLNGTRAAAALPQDFAEGLAHVYEVGQDPEAAPPEIRG